jgi:hypothetical protein
MEKEPVENDQSVGNEVVLEADADDIQTEKMDAVDHQWEEARYNLDGYVRQGLGWEYAGKGNAGPMGDLLARGFQPPPDWLVKLGAMLSPPGGYQGPRLNIVVPPKKTVKQLLADMATRRMARIELEKLRMSGTPHKEAVHQVRVKFKKSRSWVTGVAKLSDKEIVFKAQQWLGNVKTPRSG